MVNLISDILRPFILLTSPIASMINRINKSSFFAKFIIYFFRPIFWMHEFFLKYKSSDALLSIAIFDDSAKTAGYRLFYLRYRNWSRYEFFDKVSTSLSLLNWLCAFSFSWFLFLLLLKLFASSHLLSLALHEFSFLALYPIPIALLITFIFCSPNSYATIALDTVIFCFVCDQEMFQGFLFFWLIFRESEIY
jgi:hypothetical protein